MGPDFASYNFEWLTHSPRWRDHYFASDQRPHYAYLKDVLRLLQWRRGERKRWVLKCPQHLEQLPAAARRVPRRHGDLHASRSGCGDPVDGHDAGLHAAHESPPGRLAGTRRYWPARIERLLRACARDRDLVAAARSFDSRFDTFMADPMATLESVYRVADLELTQAARNHMQRYLDEHPRGKDGQVVYRLERDFGLVPAAVRERFGFYFERFGVRAEVR